MPVITLTPPGGGHPVQVTVGDDFSSLKPAEQQATVNEISQSIFPHLKPGDDSFGAALKTGEGNAIGGLENVAGDVASKLGYKGFAQSAFAKAKSNENAGNFTGTPIDNLVKNAGNILHGKDVLNSLGNVGGSLANLAALQAPTIGAGLAASAAAPEALLGGAAGALGAGAYFGANAGGQAVQNRMDAQGESAPSNTDLAVGAADGGVQGALGAVGLGKLGASALPGVAARSFIPRLAANAALDGTAGALGNVANQAASTVGTPGGLSVDPGQVETAGLASGVARAAAEVPLSIKNAVVNRGEGAVESSPQLRQESLARIGQELNNTSQQIQNMGNGPVSHTAVVNSVFTGLKSKLQTAADQLVDQGYMTKAQKSSIFDPLMSQAGSHKNAVGISDASTPEGVAASAFDQFNQLGIPDEVAAPIRNGIRDLDTLSQNKLYRQQSGPFQKGLGMAGKIAAAPLVHSMGGGIVQDLLGLDVGHSIGSAVGGKIDRALGIATPAVVRQAQLATKVLNRNGVNPGPTSSLALQQLSDKLGSPEASAPATPPVPAQAPTQTPVQAPSAAPTPPPATVPAASPMPPPAASVAAPEVTPQSPLRPVGDLLKEIAFAKGGAPLSDADIHAGIDRFAGAGGITPAQADGYKAALSTPLMNVRGMHNANLDGILKHALAAKGIAEPAPALYSDLMGGQAAPGGGAGIPNGGPNPVRNAYQFNGARTTYQAVARDTAMSAERNGYPQVAAVIRQIAMEPSVAAKQALADSVLKTIPNAAERSKLKALYFGGKLLTQGTK